MLSQRRMDELVDFGCVAYMGISHEAESIAGDGLKHGEQRMLLLQLGHLSGIGGTCFLGSIAC